MYYFGKVRLADSVTCTLADLSEISELADWSWRRRGLTFVLLGLFCQTRLPIRGINPLCKKKTEHVR